MHFKNTAENYGAIAKYLHWGTAILILSAYASVYYRHWFTERGDPDHMTVLHIHLSIGVTVAVIVFLRILWRLSNRQPNVEPGSRMQHLAMHVGHYGLYCVLIIACITGYLGTGLDIDYFFMFEITSFKNSSLFTPLVSEGLGMTFKEFEKPIDFVHKKILGEWLTWLLVLGHVLAALYHHYIKKDRTLEKMTISKK